MVLVDTPVWSLALGRRSTDLSPSDRRYTQTLFELVQADRVRLPGVIRQEVLSGIREESQFRRIRDYLRGFPHVVQETADYEDAATFSNVCRRAGIATSPIDMLICAVALRRSWWILTIDNDFAHYRRVLPQLLLAKPTA